MNKRRRYKAKRRRARSKVLRDVCSRVPRNLRGWIMDEIGTVDEWQWRRMAELMRGRGLTPIINLRT